MTRKSRGAETQRIVATYLAGHGWPYATDAGAGRPGADILGTPGLVWEVKARTRFDPLAWLKQAERSAEAYVNGVVPLVVVRPNGMGPVSIADWPMLLRFGDGVTLLRAAGYGDPEV